VPGRVVAGLPMEQAGEAPPGRLDSLGLVEQLGGQSRVRPTVVVGVAGLAWKLIWGQQQSATLLQASPAAAVPASSTRWEAGTAEKG
jgi:hypothetical protein